MRPVVHLGRLFPPRPPQACLSRVAILERLHLRLHFKNHSNSALQIPGTRPNGRSWRRCPRYTLMAAVNGVVLGAAAFVQLSEDNGGTDQTSEQRMLHVSRDEIKKKVDENDRSVTWLWHEAALCLDLYIREPICTGIRFLQLVVIFVPVILAVPAIWIGKQLPDRDNERMGTLWWYGFLVQAMEWAGPAFIKVL
jgi:aarF domain-containing kinase